MTTGVDLCDAAIDFLGEPYSTGPGRADPNSGYKDCSGLIAASYLVATGNPLGADVSVTIYDLCVQAGLWCSFETASRTPGACLLMPENPYQGWGPNGHIGFSDGVGGTIEATPNRVQTLPLNFQNWGSNACLLPGINYSGETPEPLPQTEDDDMPALLIRAPSSNFVVLQQTAVGCTAAEADVYMMRQDVLTKWCATDKEAENILWTQRIDPGDIPKGE